MGGIKDFSPIRESREFTAAYKRGRGFHTPFFVLFYLPSKEKKVGFVASKKIGNAVKRNRAKRRLRGLFGEYCSGFGGGLYVFVAKRGVLEADFDEIRRALERVLPKIGARS